MNLWGRMSTKYILWGHYCFIQLSIACHLASQSASQSASLPLLCLTNLANLSITTLLPQCCSTRPHHCFSLVHGVLARELWWCCSYGGRVTMFPIVLQGVVLCEGQGNPIPPEKNVTGVSVSSKVMGWLFVFIWVPLLQHHQHVLHVENGS